MHTNIKILHREIQGKKGHAQYFILIEFYRDIPAFTYLYEIPKTYIEPPDIDYNDVEVYAPICPN